MSIEHRTSNMVKSQNLLPSVATILLMVLAFVMPARAQLYNPMKHWAFGTDLLAGASNTVSAATWLERPVNVRVVSKSATGDGVADDTTYVQAALTAMTSNSGEVLYLQGKTYGVTALTWSKNGVWIVGPGKIKFLATNTVGLVWTGNDLGINNIVIDGNSMASFGMFVNTGSKRGKLLNTRIENIYGDSIGGSATIGGLTLRKGVQDFLIDGLLVTNVTHASGSGRVSRGIVITDFGLASTNDQVRNIKIVNSTFNGIAPGKEGDCIVLNTDASYGVGLQVMNCRGFNYGQRFGKVEGSGTSWVANWAETHDAGLTGYGAFSGFSMYGATNLVNGNTIVGNHSLGVEFGSYSPGFEAFYGQANGNMIIFSDTGSATNGVGIDWTQHASQMQANGNTVKGGRMGLRMQGSISNCVVNGLMLMDQVQNGVVSSTDGTNAPSGVRIANVFVNALTATNGVQLFNGTNIDVSGISGTVSGTLVAYGSGVTGNRGLEMDGPTLAVNVGSLNTTNSLVVGGGTAITKILTATATLDFPNTAAQAKADLTITVTGAAAQDGVVLRLPATVAAGNFSARVSAADTVTVTHHNYTAAAVDPASATYGVTVVKY